jgi:hypothetical protein
MEVRDNFSDELPNSLAKCAPVSISKVLRQMPALRSCIINNVEDSDAAWRNICLENEDRR